MIPVMVVCLAGVMMGVVLEVQGEPVRSGAVEAELIAEADTVAAGGVLMAGIRLRCAPRWHVYWENPGDSGTPVKVTWVLPEGVTAGELRFPVPKAFDTAGFVTYGHEGDVLLLAELRVAPGLAIGAELPVRANVAWLACDPSRCVPGRAELPLMLKVTGGEPRPNRWTAPLRQAGAALPQPLERAKTAVGVSAMEVMLTIDVAALSGLPESLDGAFFPAQPGLFKLADPGPVVTGVKGGKLEVRLQRLEAAALPPGGVRGVLAIEGGPALWIGAPR